MSTGELRLGILGEPGIENYSLSPIMHRRALQAAGLKGDYTAARVLANKLNEWLQTEAPKFNGFNVTKPHKIGTYQWLKEYGEIGDPKVNFIKAVNTVLVKDGNLIGHNTDVNGFLIPLVESQQHLEGWRVVLLGSGGAAHAIAFALEKSGVSHLTIWNRSSSHFDRAVNLAKRMNELRGSDKFCVSTSEAETLLIKECQLLINATSLGIRNGEGEIPSEILRQIHKEQLVYDIVYDPVETVLIRTAIDRKAAYIAGWQMLAGQGAVSFHLWTGKTVVDVNGESKSIFRIMRDTLADELSHRTEGRAGCS